MAQKQQGTGQDQAGDRTRQNQQQSDPGHRREEEADRTRREIMGEDDIRGNRDQGT